MVPNLVEGMGFAAQSDGHAGPVLLDCGLDLGKGVGLGGAGRDAGVCEPGIAGKGVEEVDGGLEVVYDFLGGGVVGVAVGFEGGDAGAVFGPFVLPEGFVVAFVVLPVGRHVGEEGWGGGRGGENRGDVFVDARGVAVGFVGAVAAVGP